MSRGDFRGWTRIIVCSLFAFFATLPIANAAAPEVVRARVPASKVTTWFPKGTELVSLPVAEFETLLRSVQSADAGRPNDGPILLRAVHHAVWIDGVLRGETTLDIRRGARAGALALEPFNVLLDSAEARDFQIRTSDAGAVSLWLPPDGPNQVTYRWRATSRAGTDGLSFSLDLPRAAVGSFELDLPDNLVADRFAKQPRNDAVASGHSLWSLASASNRVEIRLRSANANKSAPTLPWVSGPTVVDVAPLSATWRCDWTVDLNGGHGPLTLAFSEGLEPLSVTGPAVTSFTAGKTPQGAATLTVQFDPDLAAATSIVIRGVALLQVDRPWTIPAARPVDGVWTGGTTTVHLERSHLLESCRVLQGRRLSPGANEPADRHTLVFDPERPEPPAELTFLKTPPLSRATVHGYVRSSQGQTKLTALVRWSLARGKVGVIAFDLPREWSVESITQEDEPLTWHSTVVDQNTLRVQMLTPPRTGDDDHFAIQVDAIRKSPPGLNDFELPRIRPAGVPASDETWVASADGGRVLTPLTAKGVAWIDPASVRSAAFQPETGPGDIDHAIGWRYVDGDAKLVAAITMPPRETRSHVEGKATIANRRLLMEWNVTIRAGSSQSRDLPIFFTLPPPGKLDWKIVDEANEPQPVSIREMTVEERLDAGFAREGGTALAIALPQTPPTAIADNAHLIRIKVSSDSAWTDPSSLPLLCLGETFHARASLALIVDERLLPTVDSRGLEIVEPLAEKGTTTATRGELGVRASHRFNYEGVNGTLKVSLTPPAAESPLVVIKNAMLQSTLSADGAASHRLALEVLCRPSFAEALVLTLPAGTKLSRVLVRGKPLTPASSGARVVLALPPTNSDAPLDVLVEYASEANSTLVAGMRLVPAVPQIEGTCHSFSWQVSLPTQWRVARLGNAVLRDGVNQSPGVLELLTAGGLSTSFQANGQSATQTQRLRELLNTDEQNSSAALTVGEWLGRLESSEVPVLVDAAALAEASLTSSSAPFGDSANWKENRNPTRFERGPLVVIPTGSAWIVTTREVANSAHIDWSQSPRTKAEIRRSLLGGDDLTSRLKYAHAWRHHSVPAEESSASNVGTIHLRCNGWPTAEFWCEVEPEHLGIWRALGTALTMIVLGLVLRAITPKSLRVMISIAVAIGLTLVGFIHYAPAWIIVASWLGAAGLVLAARPKLEPRLSVSITSASHDSSVRSGRTTSLRHLTPILLIGSIVLAWPSIRLEAQAVNRASDVIIVLMPYDGEATINAAPTHVIMKLADLERLKAIANPPAAPTAPRVDAIEARHECRVVEGKTVLVRSEYLVVTSGDEPADWRLRSEGAWNLQATLDGRDHPLRVVSDGNAAIARFAEPGRHRLVFERMVRLQEEGESERLAIGVNPVALTHLEVSKTSAYPFVDIDYPNLRSSLISSNVSAEVGLVRTIGINFRTRAETARLRETFSALALWDARIAGDHVRLRLTPNVTSPISRLRFAVLPGTQIRLAQPGRLADQRWEGTTQKPEWVATFDPPFRRPEEILVEVWRPLSRGMSGDVQRRRAPSVTLAGNASFSGAIAFRRPSDWSGRLNSANGFDPIDEETFVRSWGTLPAESLTLAGATGFLQTIEASAETTALAPRFASRPQVRVDLGEGRVDLAVDAELTRLRGSPVEFDLVVPADLTLDGFTVDGLACLSRPEPRRLHVELNPVASETRKLALKGHITVAPDQPLSESRRYRVITPWIGWRGANELPGQLTVQASVRPQLAMGTGVSQVSVIDQPATGAASAAYRAVYQVEQPSGLSELVWQAAPPNVKVRLFSRLTMSDESSQLTSSIRYNVTGGPIDVLYLKVPTTWAAGFQIELLGETTQRIAETRGEWTLWTIRPNRPVWGTARLAVRSSRPNTPGASIAFPDIIPLGHGSVDRLLAVERQTSTPIEIEGSSGLQTVDLSRVNDIDLFDINLDRVETYRVRGDSWGLSLLVRGDRSDRSPLAEPQVRETSYNVARDIDGTTWGRARFLIDGRRGAMFHFDLSAPASVLAATVDGRVTSALRESPARWCLAVDSPGEAVVDLYWHAANESGRGLVYPHAISGDGAAIFQMSTEASARIRAEGGAEEIPEPLWMLERVDRLARRVVSRIGQLDRSSTVDEARLRRMISEFAEQSIAVRNSVTLTYGSRNASNAAVLDSVTERLTRTREVVSESLAVNGLEDLNSALDLSAVTQAGIDRTPPQIEAIAPPLRGLFSTTNYFRTTPGSSNNTRRFELEKTPETIPAVVLPICGVAIGFASLFVSGWTTRGLWRRSRVMGRGLSVGLCLLALICPIPALFLLAMNAAGRHSAT